MIKFRMVTYMGELRVLETPLILGVLPPLYLCLHPLTSVDQISGALYKIRVKYTEMEKLRFSTETAVYLGDSETTRQRPMFTTD